MKRETQTPIIYPILIIVFALTALYFARPSIVAFTNKQDAKVIEAHNKTSAKVKKQVEDTARAHMATYTSDKLAWENSKNSKDPDKQYIAESYLTRMNTSAAIFNEYMRKNSHVWEGNIPSDIDIELPYVTVEE